jgi:hypothetical protein
MTALAERVGKDWRMIETAIAGLDKVKSEWKFSKTSGWHLTFDRASKRLFYCFPRTGGFLLKIVYNDKGVQALKKAGLEQDRLKSAKKYPEGTLLEFTADELTEDLLGDLLKAKMGSVK